MASTSTSQMNITETEFFLVGGQTSVTGIANYLGNGETLTSDETKGIDKFPKFNGKKQKTVHQYDSKDNYTAKAMASCSSIADNANNAMCATRQMQLETGDESSATGTDIDSENEDKPVPLDESIEFGGFLEINPQKQKPIHQYVSKENNDKFIIEEKFLSECKTCECKFVSRYLLAKHTVSEHNYILKPYSCDFCKAPFNRFLTLKGHMSVKHINRRKFKCITCNKMFDQRKSIASHVKMHRT